MANKSNDYIRLDVNSGRLTKKIYVRQGDTVARTICASIVNNGQPLSLEDALIVEITINRADGNISDNGCVVVGNEIQYTLRTSDISAIGENTAQFVVTYKNGETFASPEFCIEVYQKNLSDKTIKSASEYTAFAQALVLANEYSESAKESASTISSYTDAAASSATQAAASETNALTSQNAAADSATQAANSAASALASKSAAATSEANVATNTTLVETKTTEIYDYEWQAGTYADNAATSAETASSKATQAESSATNSLTYSTNASNSADNAATHEAGALDYYNKTKALYDSLGTALIPKGTKTFEELDLESASIGDMFNISNDFTTTSDFEEGAGIAIAAGTNVYKDANSKWDCMAAGAKIVVDTTLDSTSENPIANKTVTEELGKKIVVKHLDTLDDWEALTDAEKDDPYTDYVIDEDYEQTLDAEEIPLSSDVVSATNVKAGIEEAYRPIITTEEELSAVTEVGNVCDATLVKAINTNLTDSATSIPFKFGIDSDGNYGYIKDGADSVTPFKKDATGIDTDYIDALRMTSGRVLTITEAIVGHIYVFSIASASTETSATCTISGGTVLYNNTLTSATATNSRYVHHGFAVVVATSSTLSMTLSVAHVAVEGFVFDLTSGLT